MKLGYNNTGMHRLCLSKDIASFEVLVKGGSEALLSFEVAPAEIVTP